jgi:acyl-CoA synthetase (AMP-forming)/AMP-acid ligase II
MTDRVLNPTSTFPSTCLSQLLEYQARHNTDAPAIIGLERKPLSYGRLHQHAHRMRQALRAMGIGRHDRVVVVLPNGPEMAVAIVAVAASAVCTPMHPAYGAEELERYFADLQPHALLTSVGFDSPARRAALARGIRVIELSPTQNAEAGIFEITEGRWGTHADDPVGPDDVALLVLTSGTTSRPKIVPLSHAKICASAYSWSAALALKETDRCLNVMPVFHGHGLTATVLASLAAGASVVCAPGCDVSRFFGWMAAFRPTWYSAVPTIHQAILAEALHRRERAARYGLRFIRAASAPLQPRIFADLERTFETCVINCYAMTETAAAPITCNPLPPRQRKAGSVGVPVGLDVAIMDEGEALLPPGETGQIVVRGATVMSGYDGDPAASRVAFVDDWFKTGDLGFFDDDGYLFLMGRSREIINRGGEKIAPLEVDDVLVEHPAVAEAATFAVPHPTLGEDVASAVVLRESAAATANDIRRFVIGRIADFKIPRQVLIVSEIPKGPTGKVQRVGLAAKLGLANDAATSPSYVAPRTSLEQMLAQCWGEILEVERVGIHDNFFALGGDSLSVTHVLARVYEIIHIEIDVCRFFEAPTIAEVARHLEMLIPAGQGVRVSSGIAPAPRAGGVPASIAQERLSKLQRLLPGMPFFNILYALRLLTGFDAAVLEQSLNEIVRRHEILRTTVATADGQYVQVIAPRLPVHLRFDDRHMWPEPEKDITGRQIIREEIFHCFDLAQGPLFRVRLISLTEREHLLLITMHQTIGDGWSVGVLADELATVYDAFLVGRPSPLAPLSIQYADFAYWQRRWRSHPDIASQLEYWREQLRDPLPVLRLATTSSKRTIDDLCTARRELALPARLCGSAKRFGSQEGGTLFMVLVAAFKTLLHCYLGEADLRVATIVANRNRPGVERLIGPLANTVILRTNLGGDPSPREVMRRVRATALAAFANQDLPFEVLLETLHRERAVKPAALAQVMIQLNNATLRPIADAGRALTFEEANPSMLVPLVTATTFDIILMLHEDADGLTGSCVYKPHLFRAKGIDRLLQDFQSVLKQMLRQPERPISAIRVPLNEKRWIGRFAAEVS